MPVTKVKGENILSYYLGVDGGGSKTLAAVIDAQGQLIGRAITGCGNHQLGEALAEQNIREAVNQALGQAQLQKADIAFAMFGLAGADREADFQVLRPMIASLGFDRHGIVCDTVIALRAGTHQADGVVCICGSGTNCYGINKRGKAFQCGGFGYVFGDFGGGTLLAEEVFRSVIRAWEGRGEPTRLTGAVLDALGYDSVETMYHDYLDKGQHNIPLHLSKLLFQVARHDAVAREILQRQGTELGKAAVAVINQLDMHNDVFDLVLAGSVLMRGDIHYILPFIEAQVKTVAPGCTPRVLKMEPLTGALLMAMERCGIVPHEGVYTALGKSLSIREDDSK